MLSRQRHKEGNGFIQCLEAVHLGIRIVRVPHLVVITPLIQKSRLISQAVKMSVFRQLFQYVKGMVHTSVGLVPFAGQNFQCLITDHLQRLALSPVVLAHRIALLVIKIYIEPVADPNGQGICTNPQTIFSILQDQIHHHFLFFQNGLGVMGVALQTAEYIDDPGRYRPDLPFAMLKLQYNFLP